MKARIEQVDISAGNTDDSSAADTADPKMQITSNVKEPIVVLGVNLFLLLVATVSCELPALQKRETLLLFFVFSPYCTSAGACVTDPARS